MVMLHQVILGLILQKNEQQLHMLIAQVLKLSMVRVIFLTYDFYSIKFFPTVRNN
jgi:hypothetical protein